MATTIEYGTWLNATRHNISPAADILDAINGGDSDWQQRMEESGALQRIEADYRDAVQAALPDGIRLVGDEFIGPQHGDPDAAALGTAIRSVDLNEIIDRHDVNA